MSQPSEHPPLNQNDTAQSMIRALANATPLRILKQFRPQRSALVLPIARQLLGTLEGSDVLEIGSGEPLLLAKAFVDEGAKVRALDPALAAPGVEPGDVIALPSDAFAIPVDSIEPADLTVSTLFFGAPLRQRAKRELRHRYLSGNPPSPSEVHEKMREVESALVSRLARWTRPGSWTLHISLERLFSLSADDWRRFGFEPVLLPWDMPKPTDDDVESWARYSLSGALVATRVEG